MNGDFDVIVVGAGFAGLYMLYRLRQRGYSVRVLEDAADVGGTWYWNRYPGARCDTESLQYSYQFSEELQQEWEWSERYATQPEILSYINHVAHRFDLRRDISLATRVVSIVLDEDTGRWIVTTDAGDRLAAGACIMATGCLSSPNTPDITGLCEFAGTTYHTARWPHEEVDFIGQRVGVIGTGSSAIQSIPLIAEEAAHVTVFQRTPNYAVPAHNGPLDPEFVREFKAHYAENRARAKQLVSGFLANYNPRKTFEVTDEERRREYEERWARGGLAFLGAFADITFNLEANRAATEFIHDKIREIVADSEVAELLCPNSVVGCKRLCVDTDYYKTYNRENVTLVDVRSTPIERISPAGVVVDGREHVIDSLILATGFDAMTGALDKIDIRGRSGRTLKDKWANGPRCYLGLMTAGFPNLFVITGPGSPSVLTNMLPSIEQHVDWIADCIDHMRALGARFIEPTVEAENDWADYNDIVARATLRYHCSSWYLGSNIPGKPRVFMPFVGGLPRYIKKCEAIVAAGYEGFVLSSTLEVPNDRSPGPAADLASAAQADGG